MDTIRRNRRVVGKRVVDEATDGFTRASGTEEEKISKEERKPQSEYGFL